MYFFFILFFVSLTVIILMITRKLSLLSSTNKEHIHVGEILISDVIDFQKIKNSAIKNIKKILHSLVWFSLKAYILSLNFLKNKKNEFILKIKNKLGEHHHRDTNTENKEVSKYMQIISEYKQKIHKMKHRIKEQEGIE